MKKTTTTNTRPASRPQTRKHAPATKPQPVKADPSENAPITWKHGLHFIELANGVKAVVLGRLAVMAVDLVKERTRRKQLENRVALLEKHLLKRPDTLAAVLDDRLGEIRETQTNGFDDLAIAAHWRDLTPAAKLAHLERIGLSPKDLIGGDN